MITTILWDFNGTLLDDVQMAVDVMNEVFSACGFGYTDTAAYRHAFRFPVKEYYADRGIVGEDFIRIGEAWNRRYNEVFPIRGQLAKDAMEAVEAFRNKGCRQVIVSATHQKQLDTQLALFPQLRGMLDGAFGIDTIYGTDKTASALRYMKECGARPEETCFIGDTTHDAAVAAAIGCRCILVKCGHQDESRLLTAGVPLAEDLREVIQILAEEDKQHG